MTLTLSPSRSLAVRLARNAFHALDAVSAVIRAAKNRRIARHVSELSDDLLADIGLKRDDVCVALRTGWRDDPTFVLRERATLHRLEN